MPFSLRLDPETEARIRKLTRTTGRSKAAIVREAVAQYRVDPDAPSQRGESIFDRLKPFIGIIDTGGAEYSRNTHAKYRAALRAKHRGGRPRRPR
jgi:ribbon-helix-helix CopG family protein